MKLKDFQRHYFIVNRGQRSGWAMKNICTSWVDHNFFLPFGVGRQMFHKNFEVSTIPPQQTLNDQSLGRQLQSGHIILAEILII